MASKKRIPAKHCRIFQWVEAQDPEFAGAIRDLCLEGLLAPGKKGSGVTFLYPQEASAREHIVQKAYTAEGAEEAVRLVEGLIVPDALHKAADFQSRQVGNRLGVPFGVESAGGSKVRLTNGAELTLADDFHPFERRAAQVAVWRLRGHVPAEGSGYTPPARAPKSGGNGPAPQGAAFRIGVFQAVLGEFARWAEAPAGHSDPFLAAAASLLNSLDEDDLARVGPLLDYYPHVTLILLLEPCKRSPGHLLSDEAVMRWGNVRAYRESCALDYEGHLRRGAPPQAPQRGAAVDEVRANVDCHAGRAAQPAVAGAYTNLEVRNAISGLTGVLPPACLQALAGGKKLWQDELRHNLHAVLEPVVVGRHAGREVADKVWACCHAYPGDDYARETKFGAAALAADINPRARLIEMCLFVHSTDFLYVLSPPEAVNTEALGTLAPFSDELFNANGRGLLYLRSMERGSGAGISPQTLRELELYVRLNHKLPDSVTRLVSQAQA